jgi:hypothetical protein
MAEDYIPLFNRDRKRDTLQELMDSIGAIDSSVSPQVDSIFQPSEQRVNRGVQDKMAFYGGTQDLIPLMGEVSSYRQKAKNVQRPEIIEREGLFARQPKNRLLRGLQRLAESYMANKGYIDSDLDIAQENLANIQQARELQDLYGTRADESQEAVDRQRSRLARFALGSEFIDETSPEVMAQTLTPDQIQEANVSRSGLDMSPLEQGQLTDADLARTSYEGKLDFIQRLGSGDNPVLTATQTANLLTTERDKIDSAIKDLRVPFTPERSVEMNRPPNIGDQYNPITNENVLAPLDAQSRNEYSRYGVILTDNQRKSNDRRGKEFEKWEDNGQLKTAANIDRLNYVQSALVEAVLTNDKTVSGPFIEQLPESVKKVFFAKARNIQDINASVTQQSLRELLGGQFAVQENNQLIQRAYDQALPPIYNLARVRRTNRVLKEMFEKKNAAMAHWNTHQTMYGARGSEQDFYGNQTKEEFETDLMNRLFPTGQAYDEEILSELTPQDLVDMREAVMESGDAESLRLFNIAIDLNTVQ